MTVSKKSYVFPSSLIKQSTLGAEFTWTVWGGLKVVLLKERAGCYIDTTQCSTFIQTKCKADPVPSASCLAVSHRACCLLNPRRTRCEWRNSGARGTANAVPLFWPQTRYMLQSLGWPNGTQQRRCVFRWSPHRLTTRQPVAKWVSWDAHAKCYQRPRLLHNLQNVGWETLKRHLG